jgi:hypothetical protein
MKKQQTIQRVPRPKGFTLAISHIRGLEDPNQKQEKYKYLKNLIIHQWTMGQQILNGESYTPTQLANYLNVGVEYIMRRMNKVLVKVAGMFDNNEQGKEFARAQLFRLIFGGLETEALMRQQAHILLASQGQEYKAFISGEVNRALANMSQHTKSQLDVLKLLTEKDPAPLIGSLNVNNDKRQVNYISTDQAIDMIRNNSKSMLEDTSSVAAFADDPAIPNVDARTQDLTKIGIKTLAHPGKAAEPHKAKKKAKKNQLAHNKRPDIIDIPDKDSRTFIM